MKFGSSVTQFDKTLSTNYAAYYITTRNISFLGIYRSSAASNSFYLDDATATTLTFSSLHTGATLANPDVNIGCKIHARVSGTQCGLFFRVNSLTSPTYGIYVYFDGAGKIAFDFNKNGTWSSLTAVTTTFVADKWLRVNMDGLAYRVYYNDVLIFSGTYTTDANIDSNTCVGLFSTDPGNQFAAIEGFAIDGGLNAVAPSLGIV
jgi:hypothetical protein